MNDRQSFIPMLEEPTRLFGEGALNTVAADKGYWSSINKEAIVQQGIPAEGLQKPGKTRQKEIDMDLQEHLHNRRAGIEPLIGYVKRGWQMERSRMRSDQATLGAGYGSVLGFNLRQMLRHQKGKIGRVG